MDEYLQWDPVKYPLANLVLPASMVWVPDIAIMNSYVSNIRCCFVFSCVLLTQKTRKALDTSSGHKNKDLNISFMQQKVCAHVYPEIRI